MKNAINLTIFTPTYNRKKLLEKCYQSLFNQSNKKFIWLIIDDGSTDNTREYINSLKNIPFPIKYIYQKNSGKSIAHNTAVLNCKTEYFLILDSDDLLTEDAIKIVLDKIKIIDNLDWVSGIIGDRIDSKTGKVIGTPMPKIKYTTGLELYQKLGYKGDTVRIYKTKILKNYLFPKINGEKFIPENYIFDQIDLKYKLLIITEKIYIGEYQKEGYSKNINKIKHNNPIGYSLSLCMAADTALILQKKINWTILYIIWCHNFRIRGFKQIKHKFRYILCIPFAYIMNIFHKPSFLFKSIQYK